MSTVYLPAISPGPAAIALGNGGLSVSPSFIDKDRCFRRDVCRYPPRFLEALEYGGID